MGLFGPHIRTIPYIGSYTHEGLLSTDQLLHALHICTIVPSLHRMKSVLIAVSLSEKFTT